MKVLEPVLTISPATIPNGKIGVPYSQTIQVGSQGNPVSWTVEKPLPAGFILTPAEGTTAIISCEDPQVPFDAEVVIQAKIISDPDKFGIARY